MKQHVLYVTDNLLFLTRMLGSIEASMRKGSQLLQTLHTISLLRGVTPAQLLTASLCVLQTPKGSIARRRAGDTVAYGMDQP